MPAGHKPVLLQETINRLNIKEDGIYVDGTLGRGGHTEAILESLTDRGLVIGIDRDLQAIKNVERRLGNRCNLELVHGNFVEIPAILDRLGIERVDGMVFDLGMSSPQVDNPDRGFSYQQPGPLDMRMNQKQELTAARIINQYSRKELTEIIGRYGEEKWASRIADFIVNRRQDHPITTTDQLVKLIKAAIPASARRGGGHPARRTFQAFRIATNDELNQLEEMLDRAVVRLRAGGRICVISFHSLEDRIVKHSFREQARDCVCPPDFPICVCDHQPTLKVITGSPIRATETEIGQNPRARSARLRVAERVKGSKTKGG